MKLNVKMNEQEGNKEKISNLKTCQRLNNARLRQSLCHIAKPTRQAPCHLAKPAGQASGHASRPCTFMAASRLAAKAHLCLSSSYPRYLVSRQQIEASRIGSDNTQITSM
ncbi:hypothetical protein HAX54_022578 [Datura stramonium]|uniref:Uncharacterized protein n=1 Tax=Datura stramonium TaxID=4076 RepID=A0ABS8UUP8_DATST|nr:hypothetical protein [Datura stramonium]